MACAPFLTNESHQALKRLYVTRNGTAEAVP